MKGHHHESCPHCVLQQGELVVNMSCVLWDNVSESTRPLGQVKIALTPKFLIAKMQGFGNHMMLFNLL